jgi:putative DNA primase/helicase
MIVRTAPASAFKQPGNTECFEFLYRPAALGCKPERGVAIVRDADVLKKAIADIPSDFETVIATVEQIYAPDDTPPLGHLNYLFDHMRGRSEVLLFDGDDAAWHSAMKKMLADAGAQEVQLPAKLDLIRGDAIRIESIDWLWNGWLAKGKLHILAGVAGTGKTTIALSLAAIITTGGRFPDQTLAPVGDVAIWSGEDGIGDTLAPRLSAAKADMKRVHFIRGVSVAGDKRPFDPAHDTALLAQALESIRPALLIVDPIVSAVSVDSNKNAETRRALQPLVDMAAKLGVAVLGISHFSKGTQGRNTTERVTGSLAFGALARVVMAAAKLEGKDETGRIFCRSKSNIGRDDGGFRYDLEQRILPNHTDIIASCVVWGDAVDGAARELLAEAEAVDGEGGERAEAKEFLESELAGGAIAVKTIKAAAEHAGHSWATIRRAKNDLGVTAKKTGMNGGWEWKLPPKVLTPHEDAHPQKVNTFGENERLRTPEPAEWGADL